MQVVKKLDDALGQLGCDPEERSFTIQNIPVALASHHCVYEHQKRARRRAAEAGSVLMDEWGVPSSSFSKKEETVDDDRRRDIDQLGRHLLLDFETAWNSIECLMTGYKARCNGGQSWR